MLSAAQDSLSPSSSPRSMFREILIFLLVSMIISIPQSLVTSLVTTVMMFFDEQYAVLLNSMLESGVMDYEQITEFALDFMNRIPPEVYIAILAASGLMIPGGIIYCGRIEKRPLFSMGFTKRGLVPEYLLGIGVGVIMITIPALLCAFTGAVTLVFNAKVNPVLLILFFLAFVLQGMGEEVLLRGYLLMTLSRRFNVWTAIIMSSLMFSVMHIANASFGIISFVNITLFGVFAAVYMLKRGSIWGVAAIHTVWNFMQGNIYGFSVSGMPKLPTLFDCIPGNVGAILSGGDFGIEGGLGATAILIAALAVAFAMPAKKSELDEIL